MPVSIDQLIVWIVVGIIAGSIVGRVVKRERHGFGLFPNLGLGLAGAVIGGLIFRLFGVLPSLDLISFSLRDVIAAIVGSLIVLAGFWLRNRYRRSEEA